MCRCRSLLLILIFYGAADHRDLASFPTRRSSDLSPRAFFIASRAAFAPKPSTIPAFCESTRSEEHTSELQSRGHLVCRLLLEKKKQGLNADLGLVKEGDKGIRGTKSI